MPWHARLSLDYQFEASRSVARHQHEGPLRILQSLYPEGDAVCHNVLVHPPGGLVGGDTLDIAATVQGGAHGLITTPGATRFYRSEGPVAVQRSHLRVAPQARLEWLPLEAICFDGCRAENHLRLDLAAGAECIAWDVTAFGLPHAQRPFRHGSLLQRIELPGVWLEQGRIDAHDTQLLEGPTGLAGHRCIATLLFATGSTLGRPRREQALEVARAVLAAHALRATAGVTSPNDQVVVVRVLAPVVEPAMQLLKQIWAAWRMALWNKTASSPRIWSM